MVVLDNLIASRIRFYSIFILIGLLVAILFHYSMSKFLGLNYPWNTFLFDPSDRFNDWYNSVFSAATMDPYFKNGVAISAYFPFAYVLLQLGSLFSKTGSLLAYLSVSVGLLALGIGVFWHIQLGPKIKSNVSRHWSRDLFVISTTFCYPLIFALDRGNLDIWVAALCLIYVAVLRTRYGLFGFLTLSIAISLKGYPAAFLLLAIVDKQYLSALWTIIVSLVLTIFALNYFNGGIEHNFYGFMHGLRAYREIYVLGLGSIHFSSDPYNGFRLIFMVLFHLELTQNARFWFLEIYNTLSLLFVIMGVYFVLFVPVPRWRRVMAACLLIILFPNVANDYKLLVLLPGLFVLFVDTDNGRRAKKSLIYIAILMIPKSYFYIEDVSISGVISPFFLLLLASNVFNDKVAWSRSLKLLPQRLVWYMYTLSPEKLLEWICPTYKIKESSEKIKHLSAL